MILVTGASGFVGSALCSELRARGFSVRCASRFSDTTTSAPIIGAVAVGERSTATDWSSVLEGVDCVIHCAARTHVMHEAEADALSAYRSVNVDGSRRLAEQASAVGVRRLVYLSSIKVNVEETALGVPVVVSDAPAPKDPYGISKWEAEQVLWHVASDTGLEVVVLRSPLIYGPGVKGNLALLLKMVCSGIPLPLGAVQNQRSLIGLDNLVDLLIRCVDHPAAAGQTFLVSDGEDLSTPDLIRHMATALGCSARLVPVSVTLLRWVARPLGKQAEIDRLVGSLQIDSQHTHKLLDWSPPMSVTAGIHRMVQR